MVYGLRNRSIKYAVFTINFLIFFLGGFLFGFALWANLDQEFGVHLREFTQKIQIHNDLVEKVARYQASLWILVAVGMLLMVIGFLGCCGAICESTLFLSLFGIVLLVLSLIEAYVLIALYTDRGLLLDDLQSVLAKSAESVEGRRQLKPIEDLLGCCGATAKTRPSYLHEGLCPGELEGEMDCFHVLSSQIDSSSSKIVKFGVLLLLLQAFAIFLSSVLCNAFRGMGSTPSAPSEYIIYGAK